MTGRLQILAGFIGIRTDQLLYTVSRFSVELTIPNPRSRRTLQRALSFSETALGFVDKGMVHRIPTRSSDDREAMWRSLQRHLGNFSMSKDKLGQRSTRTRR